MSTKTRRAAPFKRRIQRGNPRLEEETHDPYRSSVKSRSPVRCPQCEAVYRNGRWVWDATLSAKRASVPCPACRRIADSYPAGELTLSGPFVSAHRNDVVRLIRNVESAERAEHPLHRVMAVALGEKVIVTTTDVHLPRRIGHALEAAWGGKLTTHYDEAGYFARVGWERQ
jgi:hypothetical protein